MEKKMNNEELQNRREFFKKAATRALPILGVLALGPSILSSCEKDDDKSGNCKNGCSGSCSESCSGNCFGGCTDQCHGCGGQCEHSAWN